MTHVRSLVATFSCIGVMVASPVAAAPSGAQIYGRCAACHLPTGAGIPGTYPPLNADVAALATAPEGRRYLVLAILKGLSGPIVVAGRPYRGVMPAQAGLDDAGVAAVLNHVTSVIAKAGAAAKPFTAEEVAGVRAGASGINAAAVARMQPKPAHQ